MSSPIQSIAILMAMQEEAAPVIEGLALQERTDIFPTHLPLRCFHRSETSRDVYLVWAGQDARFGVDYIGSEAATLSALETIRCLQPDLIISAGTAGGFAGRGASIGTVYLNEDRFVFHDRHVPLAGFEESAIGNFPGAPIATMAHDLGLPQGVISTGSSLQKTPLDLVTLETHHAVAKEMEAAAIAWVAMLSHTPMIALKSITNLVDEDNDSAKEFTTHFDVATAALQRELLRVIAYLEGKHLDALS